MGTRWGRKAAMEWDQPLPWVESEELIGAIPERTATEERGGVPPAASSAGRADACDAPREGAAGDRSGRQPDVGRVDVNLTEGSGPIRQPGAPQRRRSGTTRRPLTPEQRTLQARAAAYRLHATHDPKET